MLHCSIAAGCARWVRPPWVQGKANASQAQQRMHLQETTIGTIPAKYGNVSVGVYLHVQQVKKG
jgi:hypothetical protein